MQQQRPAILMAEIAIMAALAFILDLFSFKFWAQGGSVAFAMLPIFIMAYRRGLKAGLLTGLIFGLLNMMYNPSIVHWIQAILDYPVAFLVVGFAGILCINSEMSRGKQTLLIGLGVFIGSALRFIAHFTSGVVWFGIYAPEGVPVGWYSFTYNIGYLAPSFIACLVAIILLHNVNKRILLPNG